MILTKCICMHLVNSTELKYKFFIKKCEDAEIKYLNDLNAYIKCSYTMDDVYENIDDYNPNR